VPAGDGLTSDPFIGAATAIELVKKGYMTAVAEPDRRGGGATGVVSQTKPR
jgi:gamma-glutamyltranspeptidase/glutathione hydrolase